MVNLTKKQKVIAADVAIGLGILVLAFLLKDADAESKTSGMITVMMAVILRVGGIKFSSTSCKNKNDVN
ncbi:hypothetical protein [Alteromonas facilis]|uniref:hypothetical protein n=1 Tax=Alteromonas facilis TaxID=2048004 RepID=UPI000C2813BD|nr:hypothetical protein [Alteromonas facilis]